MNIHCKALEAARNQWPGLVTHHRMWNRGSCDKALPATTRCAQTLLFRRKDECNGATECQHSRLALRRQGNSFCAADWPNTA
eukprot:3052942-Amphidinium_carterae.1